MKETEPTGERVVAVVEGTGSNGLTETNGGLKTLDEMKQMTVLNRRSFLALSSISKDDRKQGLNFTSR